MTFPSGGPGYPQQNRGGGAQPNPQAPGTGGFPQQQQGGPSLSSVNLPMVLTLVVAVLGVVNYFIGFSGEAADSDQALLFLLVGGLLAGLALLPKGPKVLPFAVLFSVLGGLYAILAVVRVPSGTDTPGIVTVILILGILQLLVAIAALLFEYNLIKLPAPTPRPAYQPYGQPGPYGQPQQGPEQQGPQGTQYGAPVTPQSTVYAPQHGQFYQPQQPESGSQQQPGTPPGGSGQQG
ncbi:DUF5336 domain-containing protein [Amycolatopsis alkalitolerans]|uniref:34 kDa antigenic family protein n=1 Tax=Amycolatopsis alkalitolerans TaxID=2547244 RepID=A0A5C4LXE7_9PSEU|nr:DUF5336 domain-containing protein [Amycolatopsis alkalitolerans]TNC21612.1 hypothetical protein FG385_27390 [Amycolatopsis alkalitolerans]